jgi:hypothetical protein
MTIDYKEKYIASRDELKVQTKELAALQKATDKLKKQLEKAAKPKKTREATPRNKEIGTYIRALKEQQPELTNAQRMTEANRLYDLNKKAEGGGSSPAAVPAPSVPVDDVSEALRMYDIEAAKA